MTLPLIRLLARVGPAEADEIRRLLADESIADPRAALRSVVDFAPDVASSQATAAQYVRDAVAKLDALPSVPARQSLLDVASFVLARDR